MHFLQSCKILAREPKILNVGREIREKEMQAGKGMRVKLRKAAVLPDNGFLQCWAPCGDLVRARENLIRDP